MKDKYAFYDNYIWGINLIDVHKLYQVHKLRK